MLPSLYNSATGSVYTPSSKYDVMLHQNPGVGFAKPDAWRGPAPVWFSNPEYENPRNASGNWLKTGDGWYVNKSDFPIDSYQWEVPAGTFAFWELPRYTGPQLYEQTQFADGQIPLTDAELEAKFGTAAANQANRDMLAGNLSPVAPVVYPVAVTPPATRTGDNATAGVPGTTPVLNPISTPAVTNAALNVDRQVNPANERYLIDGKYQDGLGNVISDFNATNVNRGAGAPQQLNELNTTARAPIVFSWGKALAWIAGIIIVLAVIKAIRK